MGKISRFTGYPKMFQLAVIEAAYPEAMKEIGIAGLLMPALAAVGKMLGYKADPFVTDD